jgi:DNA-binding NtrC family response regulator
MNTTFQLQRVLVVDDDCVIRRSAARQLAQAGYLVSTAANGNEALTLLGLEAYDAVLSDVRMPVMNGIDLLKIARGRFPALPFIIMTGWVEDYITKPASTWGAAAVLEKPVLHNELLATLKMAVNTRIQQAPPWDPALAENPTAGSTGRDSRVVQEVRTPQ